MFAANYDPNASANRLGRPSVICQKCHADNVIGVLASAKVIYQKDGSIEVVPVLVQDRRYRGKPVGKDYDLAVEWMHTVVP